METMGGWWQLKQMPAEEEYRKQSQLFEKLKMSKVVEAMFAAMKNGSELPKAEVKDLGDGSYSVETHFAGHISSIKFTLDGKPSENEGPMGMGKMTVTSEFKNGVWKLTCGMEGCPDLLVERQRVGDDIHQTKTCDGVSFTDIEKRI